MTANHDESYPIGKRLVIYSISGAIAGYIAGGCSLLSMLAIAAWQDGSVMGLLRELLPLHRSFWSDVAPRIAGVLIGWPIQGVVAGIVTTAAFRRFSHPVACASLWASIVGTPVLVTHSLFPDHPPLEIVAHVMMCMAVGAIYGFVLAFLARWLERRREKIKSRMPDQEEQHV